MDKLDESFGFVIQALEKNQMLHNSIIIFSSDNGGAPEGFDNNYGSNYPLRGVSIKYRGSKLMTGRSFESYQK